MNPPTPGHANIIIGMLEEAKENGVSEIYIALSAKTGLDDPLECGDKKRYLELMVSKIKENPSYHGIEVKIECHFNIFGALTGKIFEQRPENIILGVGSDRYTLIHRIREHFINYPYPADRVEVTGIHIRERNEATMEDFKNKSPGEYERMSPSVIRRIIEGNAISATLIRKLVIHENRRLFHDLYSDFLEYPHIDSLFNAIANGLDREEEKAAQAKSEKASKAAESKAAREAKSKASREAKSKAAKSHKESKKIQRPTGVKKGKKGGTKRKKNKKKNK
jgi:hypothetical protein